MPSLPPASEMAIMDKSPRPAKWEDQPVDLSGCALLLIQLPLILVFLIGIIPLLYWLGIAPPPGSFYALGWVLGLVGLEVARYFWPNSYGRSAWINFPRRDKAVFAVIIAMIVASFTLPTFIDRGSPWIGISVTALIAICSLLFGYAFGTAELRSTLSFRKPKQPSTPVHRD